MAILTLDRAKQCIPGFSSSDDAVLQGCVDAACSVLKARLCRDIEQTSYDIFVDGNGYHTIRLPQFPIISVQAVRHNWFPVLTVKHTDNDAQVATVEVTSTAVVIRSIKNATTTTNTFTFASYTTVSSLATAINAVSNWSAVHGGVYSGWATADIKPQGVSDARITQARLFSHVFYLSDYIVRSDVGEIYLPSGWAKGYQNFRVAYTAGYATIPEALVNAAGELAAGTYKFRDVNPNLQSESLGSYSYTVAAERAWGQLSLSTKQAIASYTDYRIQRYV